MSVRPSLRMPKGRIALFVVLFLFGAWTAPWRTRNALAQDLDLVNDTGSDADAAADEPANLDPAKPKPVIPNLAGTWNGSINGSVLGSGNLRFAISQNKRSLRGTFSQVFQTETISGNFSGAIAANNAIRMTLASTSRRGCVEKGTAQLISKFEFQGNYIGNKKCGFDRGSFDVISSLAPTPTATVTPTATPTPTATATPTLTPTATMTPLEFENPEVVPLPPLTINPPQPASLMLATVSVNFPGATNIMLSVSGDGCGSLSAQTVSGSQLSETQPVGQFGLCSLVAQVQTPSGPQTLKNGFTVEPTNVQLPALKVVDGFFVPGALPTPSGNAQQPDIGSLTVPPTIVNGGTAQLQINLTDPSKAPNVTSVLIQVQGAGGYNGYFTVPATLNGSTIIANLALDPAFGVASPSPTPTATPGASLVPTHHQSAPLAKGMIAGSLVAPASGGQLQIVTQLVDALGNVGNQMMQALNTVVAGTGKFQVTLSWDNPVDLDLHVVEPSSEEIYYGNKVSSDGGTLDLDSNAACNIDGINNENISFPNTNQPPPPGQYTVRTDFYQACGMPPQGANYTVTTRVCGNVNTFTGSFAPGDADSGGAGSGRTITSFTYPPNCQYRVRGKATYEDFAQSTTGFEASTMLPIRYAHVEAASLFDGTVYAQGETDQNGQYDLALQIPQGADPEYDVTVKTTANTAKLKQTVKSQGGTIYMKASDPVDWAMNPDKTGLDINVTEGDGAAAFNIFDQGVTGSTQVRRLDGVAPPPLTWTWTSGSQSDCGAAISCFHPDTDIIAVNSTHANPGDYNDLVLLHEYGHFWQKYFERYDSPGGAHSFTTRAVPTLAFAEGSATFFGCNAKGTSLYLSNGPTDVYPTGVRIQNDINSLDASIPLGTSNGNAQTGNHSEVLDSSLMWHMAGGISTAGVFKAAKRLNT